MNHNELVDSAEPGPVLLRGSSSVSLNERFSQVLVEQLTRSRTFDPARLRKRSMKRGASSLPFLQLFQTRDPAVRKRGSVWTRLGWQQGTRGLRGFWSFRNKYRWRTGPVWTRRRRQHHGVMRRTSQKLTAGLARHPPHVAPVGQTHLKRGRASCWRGRGLNKGEEVTRKQLDAQLDEYMSMSRSRLDKQLDDYMSRSKRRLDEQLDEYMAMAGQTDLQWD